MNRNCIKCSLFKDKELLNPMMDVTGDGKLETLIIGEAPGCFTPGTVVISNNKSYLIEENILNEKTLTSKKITNNLKYNVIDYPTTKIKISKFPEIECTYQHKILSCNRNKYKKCKLPKGLSNLTWKESKNLDIDDYVVVPKINHTGKNKILDVKKFKKYGKRYIDHKLPDKININKEISFLLGCYMGDGYSSFENGCIGICLSKGYKEQYVDKVKNILQKYFNLNVYIRRKNNSIVIQVYSRTLCELFDSLFNDSCYNKRIPNQIFEISKENISEFLFGWFVTDGSHLKYIKKSKKISSVSRLAIWDGVILGLKCGVLLGVNSYNSKKENEKEVFELLFDSSSIKNLKWNINYSSNLSPNYGEDNKYFYLRINKIKRSKYSGIVYDKSTSDHRYHIPFIVHNSWEDKVGIQWKGKAGDFFSNYLKYLECDLRKDFHCINAINCRPRRGNRNRKPTKTEINCCRERVFEVIDKVKPKHIILAGSPAIESFFGKRWIDSSFTINRWRKLQIPDHELKCWVYPIAHPSYAMRSSNEIKKLFFTDLKWVLEKIIITPNRPKYYEYKKHIEPILDYEDIIEILDEAKVEAKEFVFDFETSRKEPWFDGSKIVSISICWNDEISYSFPYQYPNLLNEEQREQIRLKLKDILEDENIKKIAQNISMENKWSKKILGVEIKKWHWDTMNFSHIQDNREKFTSLNFQVFRRWGYKYGKDMDKYKKESKDGFNSMDSAPIVDLLTYNGLDSLFTFRLYKEQIKEATKLNLKAWDFYKKALEAFNKTEERGIHIDKKYFEGMNIKIGSTIENLENLILNNKDVLEFKKRHNDRVPNFKSVLDLRELFYKIGEMKCTLYTPTGLEATNVHALEEMNHPIARKIIRKRRLEKIKNTYIKAFLERSIDNLMYTDYALNIAKTYRSSNFPFHQIPKRNEEAKRIIREGIVAPKGYKIGSVDFSGNEIKGLAVYSKDKELIRWIDEGIDPHLYWAHKVFITDPSWDKNKLKEEFGEDLRYGGKNGWFFPVVYGSQPEIRSKALWNDYVVVNPKLSGHLFSKGISNLEDYEFHINNVYNEFFNTFPGIKDYQEKVKRLYKNNGFISTFMGFQYSGYMDLEDLVNYRIQGTCFHWLLWSYIESMKMFEERSFLSKMWGQIHDEILFYIHPNEEREVIERVTNIMINKIRKVFEWINVPLNVEWSLSEVNGNWANMEEV